MTRTASAAALLRIALQDLRAGKRLLARRLPALAAAARDPALVATLTAEAARAGQQGDRIDAGAVVPSDQENLWMAGILDDADRDARSHQPGDLLDIALVGAVRKAMAAQIVSSETAIALARFQDQAALLAIATRHRAEEIEADQALAARLAALTAGG